MRKKKEENGDEPAKITPENVVQQARWVEIPESCQGKANGLTFDVALVLRPNRRILHHFAGRGTVSDPVSWSAVAARQSSLSEDWGMVFSEQLRKWSQEGQSKKVTIDQRIMLMQVLSSMSKAGAVRRALRLGDYRLCPGEVLQMEGALADKSPRVALQLLRSGSLGLPLELHFARPLTITECCVLDDAPYVMHHTNFVGFRDVGNLLPSGKFKSLASLRQQIEEHRALEKQAKVPKRIPGLSSRRNPRIAMHHGCQ